MKKEKIFWGEGSENFDIADPLIRKVRTVRAYGLHGEALGEANEGSGSGSAGDEHNAAHSVYDETKEILEEHKKQNPETTLSNDSLLKEMVKGFINAYSDLNRTNKRLPKQYQHVHVR